MEFTKNHPKVAALVRACYPSYKGRRPIKVSARETYSVRDYWDGGSRDYVSFVHLSTGRVMQLSQLAYEHQSAGNPFGLDIGKVRLEPDVAAVENVIFCGKDLGIRIYLHPSAYAEWEK